MINNRGYTDWHTESVERVFFVEEDDSLLGHTIDEFVILCNTLRPWNT